MLTTQTELEKVHTVYHTRSYFLEFIHFILRRYDAIVHALTLFIDDKKGATSALRQVLDIYVESYFHSHTTHRPLLACMLHHFAQHASILPIILTFN